MNGVIEHIHGLLGEIAAELVAVFYKASPVLGNSVFQALPPGRAVANTLALTRRPDHVARSGRLSLLLSSRTCVPGPRCSGFSGGGFRGELWLGGGREFQLFRCEGLPGGHRKPNCNLSRKTPARGIFAMHALQPVAKVTQAALRALGPIA